MIIGIASADYLRADRAVDGKEKWGGSGWARVGQYVPYIRERGHEVIVGTMWKQADGIYIEDADHNMVRPDMIVMQRLMVEGVDEAIDFAHAKGQTVVNDVDDWYWGLSTKNRAFSAAHPKLSPKENINIYKKVLARSKALIISTPYLADRIDSLMGRDIPIHIHKNYVDVSRFTPVAQSKDHVTIGWTGSTMHRSGDLQTLRGLISQVAADPYVRVHHSGSHPDGPLFADEVGIDAERVTSVPMCVYDEYPSLMTFDVGMVPLLDTPFNHAKSDIKGLEYAASGIPFVAAKSSSYEALQADWGDSVLVAKKTRDWVKHLNSLKDYALRVELQERLLENVRSRDISIGAERYVQLLEELA
jgi:glycosyltransferase involved in cell wall biosynthesis